MRPLLMQGDCLELMGLLAAGSVDLVLTDPPYGTTACKWDSIVPLDPMWEQLKRVIKSRGAIVLQGQAPFDKILGASNLSMLRYEWIWEKSVATGHLNAKKAPMKAHENLLVFYKKLPTYNPIKTTGHRAMSAVYPKRGKTTDVYGAHHQTGNTKGPTDRYPRSVIKFPVVTRPALHPTQKPVALMEYLIRTYTNPGGTVLDFTMGSGTTGVACANTGRRFIGIEKDPEYFKIASERIAGAVNAS